MSRDRSGTFTRKVSPYVALTQIDETKVNLEMEDIATALTESVNTSGTAKIKMDMDMRSETSTKHKHIHVAVGTKLDEYADVASVQANKYWLLTNVTFDSATSKLTAASAPAAEAYYDGQVFMLKTPGNCTAANKFNINNLGDKNIVGRIENSAPHIGVYFDNNIYVMPLKVGVVLPRTLPDNSLLGYKNGSFVKKEIGVDIQAFHAALLKIVEGAIAGNKNGLLKYGTSAPYNPTVIPVGSPGQSLIVTGTAAQKGIGWGMPITGGLKTIRKYTSGNTTWTKPNNLTGIKITLVGGGGGGSGVATVISTQSHGRFSLPGGGGESVIAYLPDSEIEGDLTVAVGTGGTGGTPGNAGGNGSDSMLQKETTILLKAQGGRGGTVDNGQNFFGNLIGGAGGTLEGTNRGEKASLELVRIPGEAGGLTPKFDSTKQKITMARGGHTIFQGGGEAKIDSSNALNTFGLTISPNDGIAYTGGGAGGGFAYVDHLGLNGGNGGGGIVIIEEYT